MSTLTEKIPLTEEGFHAFLETRDEPDWLTALRRECWETFAATEWPDRKNEEWMRTDIRLFRLNKFGLGGDESSGDLPPGLLAEGVDLAGQQAALNGTSVVSTLADEYASRGVVFGSLDSLVASHGDLFKPYLMQRAMNPHYDRFAALHGAFWTGGCVLYVPRGVVVDKPVHSLSAMSNGQADLGHTLVILEDGAEATFLNESASTSPDDTGFHCGGIELIQAPGSHLRYVNLQNWGSGVWHFAHQKGLVDRDASLQWTIGALGARLAKVNQHVELVGEGAQSQVNGTMFTEGKQHLAYHTLQHHRAASTRSDFLYKAALQDKSRTVWRGMIKVDPAAQQTDGYQRNDNLLLSADARADSIPGLEIEADDVRCTHGATSGRVDEEMIFYARSRGFTRKEAVRLIVSGFFQQIFDRITIDSVKEALERAIARRVREYD